MFKCNFPGKEPDEKVIKLVRKHWTVISKPLFILFGLYIVPLILYFLLNTFLPRLLDFPYYPFFTIIIGIYALFAWYLTFIFWVDYYFDVWIITDKRIVDIEQRSIFERVISTVKLYRIQDITTEVKGFSQTMFNYGYLYIQTAGMTERFVFENISDPNKVKAIIVGLQDKTLAEQDRLEDAMIKQGTASKTHGQFNKDEEKYMAELEDKVAAIGAPPAPHPPQPSAYDAKLPPDKKVPAPAKKPTPTPYQGPASSTPTPTLDKYSFDLTRKAAKGDLDPVIGRDEEINRVIHALSRRTKNNPLLVGEAGVEKKAIVDGLAQRIAAGKVDPSLINKRILMLDFPSMASHTQYQGEFEKIFEKILAEVKSTKRQTIIFIDELHTVIGRDGAPGTINASNIIKPYLSRGQLQIIAATTIDAFRKYIEEDELFEHSFQPIFINEPTVGATIEILKGIKDRFESHHHVRISEEAIKQAVNLSDQYITDRFLPEKAIDLMDEAAAKVKLQINTTGRDIVEGSDIEDAIAKKTGVPVAQLGTKDSEKLLKLEERIHERIINQEEAVTTVAEAIRRSQAGLKDPNRPIGSFLFLGPTGVGKTQLAKALAGILFGDEHTMIRFDMSEYMNKDMISRLIGSAPGQGEEGGQLTDQVRERPYSVILFDEIEKAHRDIFNLFLQILEDGRLTDSKGKTANFKNTIIIMTSNVGADKIDDKEAFSTEIEKHFSTELINRIDDVIPFKRLAKKDIREICELSVADLKKLLRGKNIILEVPEKIVDYLTEEGFDPKLGARPLRRLIQKSIKNPLATDLLEGKFKSGDSIMMRVNSAGEFSFKKIPPKVEGEKLKAEEVEPLEKIDYE